MNRRVELPPHLSERAFAVREARNAGVPWRRLNASDLDAPFHGARVVAGGSQLAALSAVLAPDQAFTGPTSANIWGMPLPRRLQEDPRIWVSNLSHDRSMRRPGVVATRRSSGAVLRRLGYPVLDPVRTWASLAGILGVHDLVAAADRMVTSSPRVPALMTAADLAVRVEALGMRRGSRAVRLALLGVREGSWSRPESLLRIALLGCGLPEPRLNEPFPVGSGRFAYPDLAWPEFMVCAEYDGLWHDDPARRSADIERHELLADVGWLVTHLRSRDLFPVPLSAVSRILSRLTERGYAHPTPLERAALPRFLP